MTKQSIYINGLASVSPQEDLFHSSEVKSYFQNILPALEEDYRQFIKPILLRRMSKAVKMGLLCSKKALSEARLEFPDAIFVGTGQGCMQDTEKFLEQIIDQKEQLLSPTSFIQSTHNTVGGQIALDLKCTGYNMTYTQDAVSFESALSDALLQLEQAEINSALVGGVEEIARTSTGFQYFDGQLKTREIHNLSLLVEDSPGTITSESAAFFVLENTRTPKTYAQIKEVQLLNQFPKSDLPGILAEFLKAHQLQKEDIDLLILGKNGDNRFDHWYNAFSEEFPGKRSLAYKHLVGDNNSVSSYAMLLAAKILKFQEIPEVLKVTEEAEKSIEHVLIYNQYLGRNHGLILLQR